MSHIPDFRKAINGRTFDREWTAYAGAHYRRPPRGDIWAGVLLAIAIGVGLAFAITS